MKVIAMNLGEKKMYKIRNNINFSKHIKWIAFIIAIILYGCYLMPRESMIDISGDAADIWKTITSYYSKTIQASYVLYKGAYSIYPYVWLYELALKVGLDGFFFIKLFYIVCFAFVSAIGVPDLLHNIFEFEIKPIKRVIFVLLLFMLQESSIAFSQFMVDLPSLFCFVFFVWGAFRKKYTVGNYIIMGFFGGISLCFSGQYTYATWVVFIYIFYRTFLIYKESKKVNVLSIASLFSMSFLMISLNNLFNQYIVEPLRAAGEWIPNNVAWLVDTFRAQVPMMKYGGGATLGDYRIAAINAIEQPDYSVIIEANDIIMTYILNAFKHPIDFLCSMGNKFFLALSCDKATWNVTHLILSYSLFFICIIVILRYIGEKNKNCSKIGILVLISLLSIVTMCITHIEMRYAMFIQNIIWGIAIFDNQLEKNMVAILNKWKDRTQKVKVSAVWINYIIVWFLFLCFCLMHFSALHDSVATGNPGGFVFHF